MSASKQENPGLITVQITVTQTGDGFEASYDPKIIPVYDYDTILNFRIVAPTPDDVVISSVKILPEGQEQLSNPSISRDGKQATLSDVNTAKQTLNLSFSYSRKGEPLNVISSAQARAIIYPEVENNPPG